ncbi:methyltransferase family protein [Solirubrobacter pauli]|uniref:Methyltransferase family protein n=1 Tax=Solirubrobacter pauli TaxID=166793 RepID=A0A660KWF4_9ACTN|nr:class I SAM-dependent methyltransferase [Solirubrobacter pauli]RKQ86006.1 methyltransferase family protein [Solirubrobacter pauli]
MPTDPYGGRAPTSHERRAGAPWDASYRDGPAPWDVGRPQPAIVRVAERFSGPVLDAGCGTGENALHVAALGLPVLGVDVAETAVALAREKAAARGSDARFEVGDALHLPRLKLTFTTVLDCGLFHTFDGDERRAYVQGLGAVTRAGGEVFVLCLNDEPHPVGEAELHAAFASGWDVVSIVPERIETRFHADGAHAWLATVRRVPL